MDNRIIRVNRKRLLDGLTLGMMLSGKSKVLSILDSIKVEVEGTEMVIMSSSMQSSVRVRVELDSSDIDSRMVFCLNPVDLSKAIKSLRDVDLTIEVCSDGMLRIPHGKGMIQMMTLSGDEFPVVSSPDDSVSIRCDLPAGILRDWLDMSGAFVSSDELRPVLCGMLMYVRSGRLGVCATDTRVLFTDSVSFDVCMDDIECIIPSSAFGVLSNVLQTSDSVSVRMDSKHIEFRTGMCELTCQLQVGRYPDFTRVIPMTNSNRVVVSKEELLEGTNRVSVFSDKSSSLMRLSLDGMMLGLSGDDKMNGKGAEDLMSCEHTGDNLLIGVNVDKFMSCISRIESDSVEMLFGDASRPILILDGTSSERRIVLMPMLI